MRIIARNDKDDRTGVSRRFFIGNGSHCAVHLINTGLSVYGDNAKVEFTTSGLPVSDIRCTVDSQEFSCKYDQQIKVTVNVASSDPRCSLSLPKLCTEK